MNKKQQTNSKENKESKENKDKECKDSESKDLDEDSQQKKAVTDDMDIIDNTECKFNVNSFKMVYVVNSESYLYKRMALKRAKEVGLYNVNVWR